MKIKLITDSMATLQEDYAKAHDIDIIRLSTLLDDVNRIEGYDGTWDEFYTALEASRNFPKTSQPSPLEYEEAYKKAFADGYDEILVLCLASGLSGTCNTAQLVANEVNKEHIHVVDSHQLSLGEHLLVELCVDMIKDGKEIGDILSVLEEKKDTIRIDFVPVTMEYLKRGGRVSSVMATIASVLNIKPVLCYQANGLTNPKKVLGMAKGITEMISRIPQGIEKAYVLYIHHSDYLDMFLKQLSLKRPEIKTTVRAVGPVLGAHVGIGSIGIAY